MSIKKSILSASAMALAASLAVGGTYAYTTYNSVQTPSLTNESDLGIVEIEQLEYERAIVNGDATDETRWNQLTTADKYGYYPDELQLFTQNKLLIPAVGSPAWDMRNGSQNASGDGSHQQSWGQINAPGSIQLFDASFQNVIDKFVFVNNTSSSDVKVRTVFAFEQGDISADDFENVIMTNSDGDHWAWEVSATDVDIHGDGNEYYIITATYLGPQSNPTGILSAAAMSYPSLLQVYMKPDVTKEIAEAIDGNDNGVYEIEVISQACYKDLELDAVFGDITAANHPWLDESK
jgi:hypothetical protein